MVRKKTEGDETQRRAKARAARAKGKAPSAVGATTGASKQRTDKGRHRGSVLDRLTSRGKGRQRTTQAGAPEPNPGSGRREHRATPKKRAPRAARPSVRRRRPA
jgi:hypothetical protein